MTDKSDEIERINTEDKALFDLKSSIINKVDDYNHRFAKLREERKNFTGNWHHDKYFGLELTAIPLDHTLKRIV